ncbi:hypothetical protein PoB_000741300 [Plakobranchus ocellatus]|uniref:Uncharacterized protein n=1 Tax=Plakobranchus ocellatus TaxID=259542 RepID=A0AAV3YER4_9GAST|nr:hypothetical protein PoB_000741300 [Plakobranchus ocellatus]
MEVTADLACSCPKKLEYFKTCIVGHVNCCLQCVLTVRLQRIRFHTVLSMKFISPQQGDLRLSGPPSGQGAGSGARTRDRRVPADLRANSQATVLPTPPLDAISSA